MSNYNHFLAISRLVGGICLLLVLAFTKASAQQPVPPTIGTTCDYSTAPATVSLSVTNVPAGYNTTYLLVDMVTGAIVQANASEPVFSNIGQGIYYAVAAHYKGLLVDATAGKLISNVYETNACLTYSTAIPIRVCPASTACDYVSAPTTLTFAATAIPASVSTTYVLVDEATNLIVQLSSTLSFNAVGQGDYAITAVHYDGTLSGLSVGARLYDITTSQNNCLGVSNTVRLRVCSFLIAISGPVDGTTIASLNPPITGTATPGSNVTVTTPDGQSCMTTASVLDGSWTCTSLTFTAGPQSVTATDGITSAVSNFTITPATTLPTLAITSPGNVTTTTSPLVSGTATPGSLVTLTDPTGATLCTTTATAGGSWSCVVNLSPGPTTLTAVACTSAGCATATTSLTAVAPPTVAILSPADNTTVASTNPPVSGTTTPLASVTVLGPNGQSCVTTASVSGTFACTSLTFAAGPQSVTALVSTAGGTATDVNNFTVVPVASLPQIAILSPANNGTATTSPLVSGTATPGSVINLTGPTGATLCTTTATVGGSWSCVVNLAPGSTTLTAVACASAGCATVTTSLTAVTPPTVAILSPADNTTVGSTNPPVSGTATPLASVTVLGPNGQLCVTTASVSGTFACTSLTFAAGPQSVTATVSNVGGTATDVNNFTVVPAASLPQIAILSPVNNGTATTSPLVSGTATPGSVINLTGPTGATLCTTTATAGGSWSCVVNLAPGSTTLTAIACTSVGCATATTSLTAVAPASLTLAPTGPTTSTSPVLAGTATPGSTVVITGPGPVTLCTTTASISGTFACTVAVAAGPTTLTAVACTSAGCATATTSLTAVTPPTVAILSPADNTTVGSTNPPVSGTATPLASVTVLGPNGQSCVTTASVSGTFACTSLTFAAGPQSVTALVSTAGGTASDVNSFTVAPAGTLPTLAILSPANNGTATTSPLVSGTATPGSVINLTGPTGATLCTTTATAGGSWSCVVNLAPGSTTLTGVACTSAGCATATTSLTAVAPPTVAILSPADNTTQPVGVNVVSGTASPGSSVTLTASNGSSVTALADPSGSFTATMPTTFSTGPNTVTAVAGNAGGISTPATSTFTVVAPSVLPTVAINNPGPLVGTTNVAISGTATPGSSVMLTDAANSTLCTTTAAPDGSYSCLVSLTPGSNTITAVASNSAGTSSPATTQVTAVAPPTVAISSPADNTTVASTNPPISGTATPLASVTVLGPNGQSCVTTASVSGTFACTSLTFAAGPQSVTALVSNAGGTATDVNNFTVAPAGTLPQIAILSPANNGTATTSSLVSGTATPGSVINLTGPTGATLCTTTATAGGTWSCVVNVSPGSTTITAVACTSAGCATATTSLTAVSTPPTVTIHTPADNSTQPAGVNMVSGTATPGSTVTLTASSGSSVTALATPSGSYTAHFPAAFPAGLNTVTAVTSIGGDISLPAISTFMVVYTPPTLAILSPTNNGTATTSPLVSGTATPGSVINLTGPTGATLCTTTATAGGSWSCVVSVSPGSTTITAVACTSAGCATATASLTAVAPPTVAILSPVDNGTVASTNPPVSGTATPLASVTVLGPNGQSCVTTASVSGTFACTSLTFAAGPQSVTALVSTAGGTASDVNNFTVAPAGTLPQIAILSPANNGTATTSPLVSGTATPGSVINLTGPTGATLCTTTATAGGSWSCVVNLVPGSTTLTAVACTSVGCATATTSLTAVAPPTVAILSPADNTTVGSTNPPISGTATPLASVTVLGPNGQSCVTTASVSGTFACTSLTFAAGPQSITALVSNAGGTATDVNNFTVVPAGTLPTLAILSPANNGTATTSPLVSGTATPGSVINLTGPTGATLCTTTATAGGSWSCVVNLAPGSTTITAVACTSAGCATATTSLTAVSLAKQPVAMPDIANTTSGIPVSGNVMTNDSDPQGSLLTASLLRQPIAGTVLMAPNGTYTYTPPTGFTGTVSFCYSVSNTAGLSSTACVSVNVSPVPSAIRNNAPIASNDNTQTIAGMPVTINVVANDTDPDIASTLEGQLGVPVIVTQPVVGTATVVNGEVVYTPPVNFTGTANFTYSICDKGSPVLCTTATVNVNVLPAPPANATLAPVAIDDALVTRVNTSAIATVAANDRDPNTSPLPLTYASGQPSSGTVTMAPNGSYTYTPGNGYVGPDSFTYSVCNTSGLCDIATVSVNVLPVPNAAPSVTPDFVNVVPGIPTTGNVLTNDRDPEGTPLTVSVIGTSPAGFTLSPNGSYTYTAPVGTTAPVTVRVQVCDGGTPPACATSTLTMVPVPPQSLANDAPIANPDAPRLTAGTSATVNVLANDVDPEGQPLSNPTIIAGPTNGTAVVNPNGTVSYTPVSGFTGTDKLTYQVCDGSTPAQCSTAVVTFTVDPAPPVGLTNVAPVAIDDALIIQQGVVSATGTVAANDYDPQGQPLTFTKLAGPTSGTVVFSPTGSYTYTPAAGFVGGTSFSYQVCDNASPALCNTATAYLTVLPAQSDAYVLNLKVMLQGALVGSTGNLMRDDLRSKGFLPALEPYTTLGGNRFVHTGGGGGETMPNNVTAQNVGTGDAVVDWVFVELRDPSNLSVVVATRSALVQRDGDVVLASDGISPLRFTGLTQTSFYVSVKHRNHLGVMTATAIPMSASGTVVDFTSMTGPQLWNRSIGAFNYEGWEQVTVNGKAAMWGGDANHDGKVKYQGAANDQITIFSEVIGAQSSNNPVYNYNDAFGYYFGDVNMDGKVKYQGTGTDNSLIFTNVLSNFQTATQMNSAQLYNFDFMREQIP
ncbi:Ig-like domain-containing protein [Rudanella paleaurantiibacter]|nr:Ig-like domain-containing protein [Rudanella paleaurantiibacter]